MTQNEFITELKYIRNISAATLELDSDAFKAFAGGTGSRAEGINRNCSSADMRGGTHAQVQMAFKVAGDHTRGLPCQKPSDTLGPENQIFLKRGDSETKRTTSTAAQMEATPSESREMVDASMSSFIAVSDAGRKPCGRQQWQRGCPECFRL